MRWQFSLRRLIVATVVLSLVFGAVAFVRHRHQYSESAKRELANLCERKGGSFTIDLVDGDVYVNLPQAHVSKREAEIMPNLFGKCISSDLGGAGRIHLDLSSAKVDGQLTTMLNEHVVGLSLEGLDVDDDLLAKIASKCPRLERLNLDGTQITDRAVPIIANLPISSLSVRNTDVSAQSLEQLRDCRRLYELFVSASAGDIQRLQAALPGCEVGR